MTDHDITRARAFVVVNVLTRERVSHELPTHSEAEAYMEAISHAEGDGFEVVPIK